MASLRKKYKNLNRHLVDAAVADFAATVDAGQRVLDIGAGTGHYRRHFAPGCYIGLDRGYEQGHVRGLDVVADIRSMPINDGVMDAAICVEVIEHVYETADFLTEIARVLRPGGRLLLTSPLCFGEHMAPWDYHRFTRHAYEKMAVSSGLEIESLQPRGGYFILLAYLVARVPDELTRSGGRTAELLKPIFRLLCTYLVAPLLVRLDGLDRRKQFTLGYVCCLRKRA